MIKEVDQASIGPVSRLALEQRNEVSRRLMRSRRFHFQTCSRLHDRAASKSLMIGDSSPGPRPNSSAARRRSTFMNKFIWIRGGRLYAVPLHNDIFMPPSARSGEARKIQVDTGKPEFFLMYRPRTGRQQGKPLLSQATPRASSRPSTVLA